MSTEAQTQNNTTPQVPAGGTATPNQGGGSAAPAGSVASIPDPKPAETPKGQEGVSTAKLAGEGGPSRIRVKDDEDIPDDAELIELSPTALKKRLNRHTKKELKERFGTDNMDDIQVKLKRLEDLEKQEEDRKRQAMSEAERNKADLEKERKLRTDAERRAVRVERRVQFEKQNDRITKIAEKHVDTYFIPHLMRDLATHLLEEYDSKQLETLSDTKIEKWFAEQVKKQPKVAKEKDPEVTVKVTNGIVDNDKKTPKDKDDEKGPGGKKYSPSRPNAMGRQEAYQEANKDGYRWR